MVRLSKGDFIPSESGSGEATTYEVTQDKVGMIHLKPSGKKSVYNEIQSYKESCNIQNIISRVANGDASVLSQIQGVYQDNVGIPTNYAEILNTVRKGEQTFNALPLEVKQKFDNDFEKWFNEYGNESWLTKMGIELKKNDDIPVEPIDKEVKE